MNSAIKGEPSLEQQDRFALDYVLKNGTPWERWRARRLAGSQEPLQAGWAERQNPDGGWRSREFKSALSNMGSTSIALMRLVWSGLSDTVECRRTVSYLWQVQQEDGRWTEDPAQYGDAPPEWNRPGDIEVDLWETANNAASLMALGYREDARVARAVAWVSAHRKQDDTYPGYLATTHAMAAVRYLQGEREQAERYLASSMRILRHSRDEEWFDVMDLTWGLILWSLAGIPREHETVRAHLAELQARRDADGTWSSRYPGCGPQYTLEALELLIGR